MSFATLLFVPGSRPDRFGKALDAGADLVCIDLEDAVAAEDKDSARNDVLRQLAALPHDRLAIRINGLRTREGLKDLAALSGQDVLPAWLLVPMAEDPEQLRIIAAAFGGACPHLVPLIETTAGLRVAPAIAAVPQVKAIMLGGADFAAELGVDLAWEPLLAARQQLVMAAAGARIAAIDVPCIKLDDEKVLKDETARVKALGFTAKAAIHPKQLGPIAEIMQPSGADIAEAEEAIAAYEAGGRRAIRFKGRMLEAPIIARYNRMLGR